MNIKLGKKETIVVIAVIIILLTIAFWMFAYRPTINEKNKLKSQQEEVKNEIQSNQVTLQRLQEVRNNASKVEAEIIRIMSRLPSNPEIPSLLIQLKDVAEKSGVEINSFKPSTPKENGNYKVMNIDLSVSSKFNNVPGNGGSLIEFLYRLENMQRVISVESVNIVRSGNEDNLTVSIRISAYSLVNKVSPE